MNLAAALYGLNSGFEQGNAARSAMLQQRNAAYLAPYANYSTAMHDWYGGQSEPLNYQRLKTEMDKGMLDYRSMQDAYPAYMQKMGIDMTNRAIGQNARYMDPLHPQAAQDASNAQISDIQQRMGPYGQMVSNPLRFYDQNSPYAADYMYGLMPNMTATADATKQAFVANNLFRAPAVPTYRVVDNRAQEMKAQAAMGANQGTQWDPHGAPSKAVQNYGQPSPQPQAQPQQAQGPYVLPSTRTGQNVGSVPNPFAQGGQ